MTNGMEENKENPTKLPSYSASLPGYLFLSHKGMCLFDYCCLLPVYPKQVFVTALKMKGNST